jgi:hypothetical protein
MRWEEKTVMAKTKKRKKRKVKRNPELLILNPAVDDKASAWRKLRQVYDIDEATEYYEEIYPDSVRRVSRNKGAKDFPFENDPDFKKATKLFEKFHGRAPDEILAVEVPQMGDADEPLFYVVLGETPAESYLTDNVVGGSSKDGSVFVHPYEAPDGKRPLKAVSADGKLIITVPSRWHKVTDWIHG